MELGELLDPGKPSRTDKVSIIADAVKAITQLRAEAHQLRQLNKFLEASPAPQASHLLAACFMSGNTRIRGLAGMGLYQLSRDLPSAPLLWPKLLL